MLNMGRTLRVPLPAYNSATAQCCSIAQRNKEIGRSGAAALLDGQHRIASFARQRANIENPVPCPNLFTLISALSANDPHCVVAVDLSREHITINHWRTVAADPICSATDRVLHPTGFARSNMSSTMFTTSTVWDLTSQVCAGV